jgi:ketosteroid isomerase-like protein
MMTGTESLTERNRAIVQAMYEAGQRGDVEALASFVTDDIVVDEPPFLPYGNVYKGKQEFLRLFETIAKFLDVSQLRVHYLIADGERVATCLGVPDLTTGKPVSLLEQSTLKDGKVTHLKLFYNDPGTMPEKPKVV